MEVDCTVNENLEVARYLASINKFENALYMYLRVFEKEPRYKIPLKKEYLAVLSKSNEELAAYGNTPAIFANLEKAIEVYPENVGILNEKGSYLYRYGQISEALCHFENALSLDSSYVNVERNLNNARTSLFPRSQFRILNDKKRNNAYKAAIKSCVTAMHNVVNIDAGSGLLAFYANECRPSWTIACDPSKEMVQLAERVRNANRANTVIIVNSTDLKDKDAYGRKSLLLTDSIDAGLFGNNILQSVYHASKNLIHKVIPGKAKYFIAGVKCDEIYRQCNLCQDMKNILNVAHMNVQHSTLHGETYCSDDVHLYKNVKYICEAISLFTIDFNNIQDVYEKIERQEPYNAQLIATENGEVNVIVGWFNLYLNDDIMLTSDPRTINRVSSYQQAVFLNFPSRSVRRGEHINIPFITNRGKLSIQQDMSAPTTRISLESITYLNDTEFTSMVQKCVAAVCVHLGQTVTIPEVNIVDLSPFPLFGILMMGRGANSLTCLAKTLDDMAFLQTVLVANGIPENKVTILVTEYCDLEILNDKKFHIIFSQIIDLNGEINVRRYWIADFLKQSHLMPGGICLPSSVTLMGQLISSKYLEMNNRVLDENVGYRMAKYVNRYQVSQVTDLDIARLKYEALSDVFEIVSCNNITSDVVDVPILQDGECVAVLCWYKVQIMENWNEIYTNRSNSFVKSMAYMTGRNNIKVFRGDEAVVLRCVDLTDRSFKLEVYVD